MVLGIVPIHRRYFKLFIEVVQSYRSGFFCRPDLYKSILISLLDLHPNFYMYVYMYIFDMKISVTRTQGFCLLSQSHRPLYSYS